MGVLKFVGKTLGTATLVVTGSASALVRKAASMADNAELESLLGRAQDASFNKIKDMWTADDKKDGKYYDNQNLKSMERTYNSKLDAAHQCRHMADVAKQAGADDKYALYMEKYHALKDEADMLNEEIKDRKKSNEDVTN